MAMSRPSRRPFTSRGGGDENGQGFFAVWSEVPAERETDDLHCMTREQAEERLTSPGFRSGRLFRRIMPVLMNFSRGGGPVETC